MPSGPVVLGRPRRLRSKESHELGPLVVEHRTPDPPVIAGLSMVSYLPFDNLRSGITVACRRSFHCICVEALLRSYAATSVGLDPAVRRGVATTQVAPHTPLRR